MKTTYDAVLHIPSTDRATLNAIKEELAKAYRGYDVLVRQDAVGFCAYCNIQNPNLDEMDGVSMNSIAQRLLGM